MSTSEPTELLGIAQPYTPKVQLFSASTTSSGYSTPQAGQQPPYIHHHPHSLQQTSKSTNAPNSADRPLHSLASPVCPSSCSATAAHGALTPSRGNPHARPMSPMRIINKLGFFTNSSSGTTPTSSATPTAMVAAHNSTKTAEHFEDKLRAVTQDYVDMVGQRDAARREIALLQRQTFGMEESLARQRVAEEASEELSELQREFDSGRYALIQTDLEHAFCSKHDLGLANTELRGKVSDLETTLEELQENRLELMQLTKEVSEREPQLHALEMQRNEQLEADYQRMIGERNALRAEVGRQFIALRMEQGERMKVVRELATLRASVQVDTKQWQMERQQLMEARDAALKSASVAAPTASQPHRLPHENLVVLGSHSSMNSVLIAPQATPSSSSSSSQLSAFSLSSSVLTTTNSMNGANNRRRNRKASTAAMVIGHKPLASAPPPPSAPTPNTTNTTKKTVSAPISAPNALFSTTMTTKAFLPPLSLATTNPVPNIPHQPGPTKAVNAAEPAHNSAGNGGWRLALSDLNANHSANARI